MTRWPRVYLLASDQERFAREMRWYIFAVRHLWQALLYVLVFLPFAVVVRNC